MEQKPFEVEYHSQLPELTDELKAKIEKRIARLADGNRDITGASVALTSGSGDSATRAYRIRIVVYKRPTNVAAVESGNSITGVVTEALDALERQVRQSRDKIRDPRKR